MSDIKTTKIKATKNNLEILEKEKLTSGSVNVYPVEFKFNSDWDGLTKTAVFRAGGKAVSVVLDETGKRTIPWEVLEKPRYILEVGVYGTKGETVVLPTIWADLGTIEEGTEPGKNAQEPTPSVYQQLIAQLDEGRTAAQEAAAQAEKAKEGLEAAVKVAGKSASDAADSAVESGNAANRAEAAAAHQPYPNKETGTWWVWDAEKGEYKDSGSTTSGSFKIGSGLTLDPKTNTLSVDTADAVEQDNTKPITSAAVFVEVGNIEALLAAL